MILLSYDNVMRGLNKGMNMLCVSANRHMNREMFANAAELWYVKGFSEIKKQPYQIEYGPAGDRVAIRFDHLVNMQAGSWRGFRGVFLFHPELEEFKQLSTRQREVLIEMDHRNQRNEEQWQH